MSLLTKLINLIKVLAYLAKYAKVQDNCLLISSDHYAITLGDGVWVYSDKPVVLNGEYLLINCDPDFEPCQKTQDSQATEQLQTVSADY
jgi:hypothetical protein